MYPVHMKSTSEADEKKLFRINMLEHEHQFNMLK